MTFELWDTESHNVVGEYESELAALKVVKNALKRRGRAFATTIALVCEDDDGQSRTVAMGMQLATLAESAAIPAGPR